MNTLISILYASIDTNDLVPIMNDLAPYLPLLVLNLRNIALFLSGKYNGYGCIKQNAGCISSSIQGQRVSGFCCDGRIDLRRITAFAVIPFPEYGSEKV